MRKIKEFIEGKGITFSSDGILTYIKENKKMAIKAAIILIVIVGVSCSYFINGNKEETYILSDENITESEEYISEEVSTKIVIDISGEVNNPMVCELAPGSRVENAIFVAGGLTDNADISNINRAELLEDGQKIYIPSKNDDTVQNSVSSSVVSSASSTNAKVNINTATSEELRTLNGVGPATAEKIIEYRNSNGRFAKIEDITNVSGIGEKTLEKFKDDICVN